jgi:hypothetical protein
MTVELEIEDGDPWYLSPNLWNVPGRPDASPGSPVFGQPNFLWAKIRNRGSTRVENAQVNYYWANPSVGFDRNTVNRVGTAYITLEGRMTGDALCLTPWIPRYIQGGHICILAEAFHPVLDPLPISRDFDVQTDRHVAQNNLSIIEMDTPIFRFSFEVHNSSRISRTFTISSTEAKADDVKKLHTLLPGNFKLPEKIARIRQLGFVYTPYPKEKEIEAAKPKLETPKLEPYQQTGYTLVGRVEDGAALVHVTQHTENRMVGGLAVLILSTPEEKTN